MQTGIADAVAAMEQAVRRLDAALADRAGAFRRLAEQHGLVATELKTLREDLQAARDEAAGLRERAALVDALRAELAQFQQDAARLEAMPQGGQSELLTVHDGEIAALKEERDMLRTELASAIDAQEALKRMAVSAPVLVQPSDNGGGEIAALKAELAAARATQTEMQAFQSGIAARLEATMARLRHALDTQN